MKRLVILLVLVAVLLAALAGPASAGGQDGKYVCWNALHNGRDVQFHALFWVGDKNITAEVFAVTDQEPYAAFGNVTFVTDKAPAGGQWTAFEYPGGDYGDWSECDPESPHNLGEVFLSDTIYHTNATWIDDLEPLP